MVKAAFSSSDISNAKLQAWIQDRIVEHCQRVATYTVGTNPPNKDEIEEAMRRVWLATTQLKF
jgi:hypothetical protein